jgi:uncharacterized protein (DUF433 family)
VAFIVFIRLTNYESGKVSLLYKLYNYVISIQDYIEVVDGVRSGKTVFKGTRITVADVLKLLAAGQKEVDILESYTKLSH